MAQHLPRARSLRNLSADELAQLNDELHFNDCRCPVCLPEEHDHDVCPVAFSGGAEAA